MSKLRIIVGKVTPTDTPEKRDKPAVKSKVRSALDYVAETYELTTEEVSKLENLRDADGKLALSPYDFHTTMQILGMLDTKSVDEIVDYVSSADIGSDDFGFVNNPDFLNEQFKELDDANIFLNRVNLAPVTSKCARPSCKSTEIMSWEKQTRSADEPITVFCLCIICGYRWRM